MRSTTRTSRFSAGLTLVEVVAGLALLATLLVALLTARARYTRQYHTAERRMAAVAAADELLGQWWRQPQKFPRSDSGRIERFRWRTRVLPDELPTHFEAEFIRLELFDSIPAAPALISIDVLLPKERTINVPLPR